MIYRINLDTIQSKNCIEHTCRVLSGAASKVPALAPKQVPDSGDVYGFKLEYLDILDRASPSILEDNEFEICIATEPIYADLLPTGEVVELTEIKFRRYHLAQVKHDDVGCYVDSDKGERDSIIVNVIYEEGSAEYRCLFPDYIDE